jgi:hypothetical protein
MSTITAQAGQQTATALAGTISGQLDLAGWDTAWLHERRGRGGEWVKSLPGGFTQATFPGMPRGSQPPAWEETARKLDADMTKGIRSETTPHAKRGLQQGGGNAFGNSAQTSVVTFNSGHKWVRKRDLDDDEFNTEVLASRVSDAIGAGAPPAIKRDGDEGTELWEPYLTGAKTAIEWEGGMNEDGEPLNDDHDPYEMYSSDNGLRIGVLDNLIDNEDRHEGNWMVTHNRKTGEDSPHPIDHGLAQFEDTSQGGAGPFGENLYQNPDMLAEIPDETWAAWQRKLAALQPDFEETGRAGAYQQMMANFNAMNPATSQAREEFG